NYKCYLSKPYDYVRRSFTGLLPHPSTIRDWYQVIDGSPGFTKEAFNALKERVSNELTIVNLVIDEMAIRDHIHWDGKKFHGYFDIGAGSSNCDDGRHAKSCCLHELEMKYPTRLFFN
ncbi:hypothetical protein ILUMI_15154, partial [Ignelater luminosus]